MRLRLPLFLLLSVTLSRPLLADMDQFSYAVTIPLPTPLNLTYVFDLASSPVTTPHEGGVTIDNVSVITNGVAAPQGIFFEVYPDVTRLQILTLAGTPAAGVFLGPVVFTGSQTDPTFVPGTYAYQDHTDTGIYFPGTLTITDLTPAPPPVSAPVPEPTELILVVTGLLGVPVAMRRRFSLRNRPR